MARTYLSVLTHETWLENKLNQTIKSTNYSIGYSGNNEYDFIAYLKKNSKAKHILFVKPTRAYQNAYNESDLCVFAKVEIIIVGPPLAVEQIGVIQMSKISGYITPHDITPTVFIEIIGQLYRNRYYANEQIPKEYWINNPKPPEKLPQPNFTKRQKEILFWLCHGFTQSDIALIIDTGVSNVENHINRIKSRIYVNSSIEVVAISIYNGWVKVVKDRFKRHTPFS